MTLLLTPSSRPAPTPQQTDARSRVLREKLRQTPLQRLLRGASSYSLATVERALVEIEGSSTLERCAGAPTSTMSPILESKPSKSQHEASQNFLKRLPDHKDRAASPGVSPGADMMAAANASPIVVGRRRRGRRVGVLGTG